LPGTSHKQDHAIKEACSGARGNLYHDLARHHKRAAGNASPNALRLTNHRRGFTCNGRLVYRRDALHDFTVTRDDLPGFYDYSIPGPQLPRLHLNYRWEGAVHIRTCPYLNNVVEQDHRRIKARVAPMLGFKRFFNARRVVAGVELVQKIIKGQFDVPESFGNDPFAVWSNVLAA
jgi:hypothetical protein